MYDIPSSVQIMIHFLVIVDSAPPSIRWITFHEKDLWLGVIFPLYPFIIIFLARMQLVIGQLIPNGWRYMLCLTLICRELRIDIEILEFRGIYVETKPH